MSKQDRPWLRPSGIHWIIFSMPYWWVNQNQTYKHELGGSYLWSPKRNANGVRNPFYESVWGAN
jgi:protein-S-isoprenylcysteine O-methyltransferase Ste14